MEMATSPVRRGTATSGFKPERNEVDSHTLIIALLATPVVAGLVWFVVFLYASSLKAGHRSWMNGESDGWALAPLGTVFLVICGVVFALQLVLLLRALPDTRAGRRAEAVVAAGFGVTVGMTVFVYYGLSSLGQRPDGFPNDVVCILGLIGGALVAVAIPVAAVALRARRHPPEGASLHGRAIVRLVLVAVATSLLVILPTVANATATPVLLVGLFLVPVLDFASWVPARLE
jgi:heme/copper-type cytochrome/quinol oxidase subunit 2